MEALHYKYRPPSAGDPGAALCAGPRDQPAGDPGGAGAHPSGPLALRRAGDRRGIASDPSVPGRDRVEFAVSFLVMELILCLKPFFLKKRGGIEC